MKKKCLLTAFFISCLVCASFAQIVLKGKVVDERGQGIPDVNVRLEQTTIGTATNNDGEFLLGNIEDGNYILRVSHVNYQTVTQSINSSEENLLITLKELHLNLNQVVVTGTGTHRRLQDSPVAVEVITAADIKKAGTMTFEETMTMLNPSFNFRPNSMGTNFTLNGLTNKYILILIDGKKMAGDVSENADLSRIDMGRVKRIEIVKGASSSLYGSDAIAGVINIITDQSKDLVNASSMTRVGAHGSFMENLNVDVNTGKFTSASSYQRRQSNGWKLSKYEQDGDGVKETRKEASNKYHTNIFNQKFTYSPTKALSVYAEGSYYNNDLIRPVGKEDAYTYDMYYKDYNFGLGGKYLLGKSSYVSLDMYADNYEYGKSYTVETGNFAVGDDEMTKRQKLYNANLKGVFADGTNNKLTVGMDYMLDYMKNPESLEQPEQLFTYAVYLQDEIRLFKKFQLLPGFRYVYNEKFKSKVTPKLSAMYSLGKLNIRATYAAGFKTPTLQELYYERESKGAVTLGNPNLKPENSDYYALNLEFNHKRISVSISGYINDVENIIVRESLPLIDEDKENGIKNRYTYQNVDKARVKGWDFNLNTYIGYGFSAGFAYNFTDPRDKGTGKLLNESVKHAASVRTGWGHTWNKYTLGVNLTGRIQGRKYFGGGDEDAVKYTLWNLTTNHTIASVGNFSFEGQLGIDNIFDFVDDRPFGVKYATLNPGRSVFASVLIRFRK
ncbi:MAG: TonB-dependent receptor [Odoribacter sp.]|nr:TonB-dependent receptor [Odoribacter sp.]